jgi:hypothetical protein
VKEQTWDQWLRACSRDPYSPTKITRAALGAITGTDSRALHAIAACWELYSVSGREVVLDAVPPLLTQLQPKCWRFAKELIARSMNWEDRDRVWSLLALPSPD